MSQSLTVRRWYPLLLLRDARGRFASLRVAVAAARRVRRMRRPVVVQAVQLVLF
jgi:hypothetical protein